MSNIIACYKWVLDEADIKINPDQSIDTNKAKGKISDYDKNAIEAVVQAAKTLGGKAVGLTFGNAKTKQSLKDALSRGLEEGYWINSEQAVTADGAVTAKVLAAAIKKIGDVSLVVCAEGASDTYARQTAPRVGAALDLPVVSSVCKMEIKGNTLIAQRKLYDCLETVKVELPAVVSVLPETCVPTIPGLKAVMAAGKKPITEYKGEDLGVDFTTKTKVTEVKGYVMNRKNIILNGGQVADQVNELATFLRKEGVL
ncbi:electron transfer flavoprotein beta subunit/FixA family protein [Desulfosporosinus fructosivorans]|uniref:Electron transfer flavoprotein small subunit n=1 Tax=Desulfosporosinus fructosivorans TaxID=2018669 RepID=A0A4Z0R2M5_9FIRM|nr:electron transfer flavoprotein beta subunit/FixA family protein [Desulfosporosinus fructosivorans]TGE37018.1 electron transfer flavoprotein beta subunit/FixA family protein [Desulfosporosinus fructosivorans]